MVTEIAAVSANKSLNKLEFLVSYFLSKWPMTALIFVTYIGFVNILIMYLTITVKDCQKI